MVGRGYFTLGVVLGLVGCVENPPSNSSRSSAKAVDEPLVSDEPDDDGPDRDDKPTGGLAVDQKNGNEEVPSVDSTKPSKLLDPSMSGGNKVADTKEEPSSDNSGGDKGGGTNTDKEPKEEPASSGGTPVSVSSGEKSFDSLCKACHGQGKGDAGHPFLKDIAESGLPNFYKEFAKPRKAHDPARKTITNEASIQPIFEYVKTMK